MLPESNIMEQILWAINGIKVKISIRKSLNNTYSLSHLDTWLKLEKQ